MAATDKPLRDQNLLDIVFAVSSIAMLVAVVLMFIQDHYREWKPEQRAFREVESCLAQRMALEQIPSSEELDEAENAVTEAREAYEAKQPEMRELKSKLAVLEPAREKADAALLTIKADVESIMSFYYISIEHNNAEEIAAHKKRLAELDVQYNEALAKRDAILAEMKVMQSQVDEVDAGLTKSVANLKKLNDKFDAMTTLSIRKQWGWGDTIRALPIIDGFASPTRIQQITNNEYGINYNFKDVTRFDRCTTCHLGIDRPAYTRENLAKLKEVTASQRESLENAKAVLTKRREVLKGLPEANQVTDPNQLKISSLTGSLLTESRVNQFAVHPRLDLFVGADSKHPIERFGCTTCHNGQGSSTSFQWASHTPNSPAAEAKWKKEHGWYHIHAGDWEFPMNPQRFVESSCLKCHHHVTDLISADNRNEAPKLLRGYNLIRENGCFGCHEIAGRKGGRNVGPDMRLESTPPLVDLTATERAKIEGDLDNRPGDLRKVGPSLYRIKEKTNEEFTRLWLRAPREFRPDTKMPHFYGVANNTPEVLPEDQKAFPDAEIHAITHYLFTSSDAFLKEAATARKDAADAQAKDHDTVIRLVTKGKLSPDETTTLEAAQRRIRLRKAKTLEDLTGGHTGDVTKGRQLFIERGCLSCHMHQATEKSDGKSPAIVSEAQFGPNLSQVAAKLGRSKGDTASAKVWLVQWLLDPQVYSPRSKMPMTHLTPEEATDVATWLLAQPATDFGPGWKDLSVPAPKFEDLENLAKVYLTRLMSKSELNSFFETKEMPETLARDLPADEREFVANYKAKGEDALKHFLGKRAVGRLGCYACHDIPGFDSARPIGVGLNDWGKKDASKLAFEDIANFFRENYYSVPSLVDEDGNVHGPKTETVNVEGKEVTKTLLPFEAFFAESLLHHGREGYLFQKLNEPRSYDHNRIRAWDELSRMPQFRFSRLRKKAGESDADFQARSLKEEAEAREAVMAFVLGLVAEPVPLSIINQPKGDRLAEVKGRQVLDNFNCNGCHLIRSGSFELKDTERVAKAFGVAAKSKRLDEHSFPGHHYWTGELPGPSQGFKLNAIIPQPMELDEDADEDSRIPLRTTRAFRFTTPEKARVDIPAATQVFIEPSDFNYPSPSVLESKEKLSQYMKDRGQYGGSFADLLVGYFIRKDPKAFPRDALLGDSHKARPLAPPSLLGQGERTQPEWLYDFLLNPFPVRKMTVLRMPKFNLSPGDAQALVDYFGAVERQQNPGVGLTFPFERIKQQDASADDYFRQKSIEYVARLKTAKASGGGDKTMFDQRVEELTPVWQSTLKDLEGQRDAVKSKVDTFLTRHKEVAGKESEAMKALDAAKKNKNDKEALKTAEAEYKAAKAALDSATAAKDAWEKELGIVEAKVASSTIEKQKQDWMERDAYLIDGFKLVANRTLCMTCHQVNQFEVKNDVQGPPLTLTHKRLRPGWTERWIANPDRHLPYKSMMPVNFPNDQPTNFQELFAGTPADRVQAVRDVLMVLPRVEQMPANRNWVLPSPGNVK